MFNQLTIRCSIFVTSTLLVLSSGCKTTTKLPYNDDQTPPKITKLEITDVTQPDKPQEAVNILNKESFQVFSGHKYRLTCYAVDDQGIRQIQIGAFKSEGNCGGTTTTNDPGIFLFTPASQDFPPDSEKKVPTFGISVKDFDVPTSTLVPGTKNCQIRYFPIYARAQNYSLNGYTNLTVNLKLP